MKRTESRPSFDARDHKDLWKHMVKHCVIPICKPEHFDNRADILRQLEGDVLGGYAQYKIHGHLSTPKKGGVPRFVPVFDYTTTAIYFACVKAFDEACAEQMVEGTFGGWALGGERRKREEPLAIGMFNALPKERASTQQPATVSTPARKKSLKTSPAAQSKIPRVEDIADAASIPPGTFNPHAWVENWQQYWKLEYAVYDHAEEHACFLTFDIANFYDSIDLTLLKSKLASIAGQNETALAVLFDFLHNWNRAQRRYQPSTKGLPMDLVGDMSRVLANFYLVEADQHIKAYAEHHGGQYLRFADDFTVLCPSPEIAKAILFESGRVLHKLGLNISTGKTQLRSKSEFNIGKRFDIMALIEGDKLMWAKRELTEAKRDTRFERKETMVKRLLTAVSDSTGYPQLKRWLVEEVLKDDEMLMCFGARPMANVLNISENFAESANILMTRIWDCPFTQPKANLFRCSRYLKNELGEQSIAFMSEIRARILGSTSKVLRLAVVDESE